MDKMNGLEFNHQVFILNGQPVIIQRSENDSSASVITDNEITLQHDSSQETHCSVNEQSETARFDVNGDVLIQDANNEVGVVSGNQFVAYVGDSEEEDVSAIHITLEQAAELGLQFDNDEIKLDRDDLPIVSGETVEQNKQLLPFNVFATKNNAIGNSNDLELTVFSNRKILSNCDSSESGLSKSTTSGDGNLAVDNPVIGSLNLESPDQQITLIPHFVNGTVAYSVQINSAEHSTEDKQSENEQESEHSNSLPSKPLTAGNFAASSISANNFSSSTLKSFTTCSNLSSFVDTNLDGTSHSEQSVNSGSENVINTNGQSVTFTSSTLTDCANSKSSSLNFTPLSDLLKCNNGDQGVVTNYQPISLSQLINSINKNQNQMPTNVKTLNRVAFPTQTSSPVCKQSEVNNWRRFTLKTNNTDKITLLKARSSPARTPLVLNNGNINIVKTSCDSARLLVPIDANKTTLVSSLPDILNTTDTSENTADNQSQLTNVNTATSKSVATVLPLIRNQLVLPRTSCDSKPSVLDTTTVVGLAPVNCTSAQTPDADRLKTVAVTSVSVSNDNVQPSTIAGRLLNDSSGGKVVDCRVVTDYQLARSTEVAVPVSCSALPATARSSALVVAAAAAVTSASSTVLCTSATVPAAASCPPPLPATRQMAPPTPTVKSLKSGDNKCILPKEVHAALNRLPMLNNTNKPLGSSENPIQLIQQGQTFHSAQALTADQLKQVTTVLQQNNLGTNIPAKNVLYDAETNTKIIYRVVYPEELDLKEASMTTDDVNGKTRKRGRPSLKSKDSSADQPDENAIVKRKQPLPRTRSGRLSRPPRYMVRDYKRIKRSELDDSDGAYSDYQSDHEEDNAAAAAANANNLLPGLVLPQKRNISSTFRCPTCNKIYLGYRRMARHFDKYSDHGTEEYLTQLKKACESKQMHYASSVNANGSNVGVDLASSTTKPPHSFHPLTDMNQIKVEATNSSVAPDTRQRMGMAGTPLSDSVNNLSDNLQNMNAEEKVNPLMSNKWRPGIGSVKVGTGFSRRRGRRKHGKELVEGRRAMLPLPPDQIKTRLRELLELCEVGELVEVAGPAVCSVLTTWDLLLLRVDSMCSQENRIALLCDEIKGLLNRFKELATSLFQPVDNLLKNTATSGGGITFQMEDGVVSSAFGVPCGLYKVNESLLKTEQIMNGYRRKSSSTSDDDQSPLLVNTNTNLNVLDKSDEEILLAQAINNEKEKSGNNEEEILAREADERLMNAGQDEDEEVGVATDDGQPFILASDHPDMLCQGRDGLDESVEHIVNEQLKSLTSQNQDLTKVEVDELIEDFSVLEQRHGRSAAIAIADSHHHGGMVVVNPMTRAVDQTVLDDPSDDLMDGFTSITDQRNHVSASTEDLIKSLENFSSELHSSACDETSRQHFIVNGGDNFNERVVTVNTVNVVDALDFDVLSQDFHHSNAVNQR